MVSRLGLWISRIFCRIAPDPFVIAILLTFFVAIVGIAVFGSSSTEAVLAERAQAVFQAWSGGFWALLKFGMQMTLVLVTGHALAASKPVARLLRSLADLPRSGPSAAAFICLVASLAGLLNWGLGLIVGAVMARDVGRSLARRGIPTHYPLLAAAGYMGLLVFHGGLSASAPLTMSTAAGVKSVMPTSEMAASGAFIGLDRTLGSTLNLVVTGGMILWLPVLCWMLHPRKASEMKPAEVPAGNLGSDHPSLAARDSKPTAKIDEDKPGVIPDWLERTNWVTTPFAGMCLAAFVVYIRINGWAKIDLDLVNMLMLGLGLLFHGSTRSYAAAAEEAARGAAGVIIQFPIYAGIMAMMHASGLTAMLASGITHAATPGTLPMLTFIAATLVGLFVPSGGAQWSIQGPIALSSAKALGVDDGPMLMAVAYGDEVANMLQPFWALPLLAITGVKAREIVGYTAIIMLAAMVWMSLWLLVLRS